MEEQDDGRLKIVEELQLERDSQEVNLIDFSKMITSLCVVANYSLYIQTDRK